MFYVGGTSDLTAFSLHRCPFNKHLWTTCYEPETAPGPPDAGQRSHSPWRDRVAHTVRGRGTDVTHRYPEEQAVTPAGHINRLAFF